MTTITALYLSASITVIAVLSAVYLAFRWIDAESKSKSDTELYAKNLEFMREQSQSQSKEIKALSNELKHFQREAKTKDDKIARAEREYLSLDADMNKLSEKHRKLEAEHMEVVDMLNHLKASSTSTQSKYSQLIDDLQSDIKAKEANLQQVAKLCHSFAANIAETVRPKTYKDVVDESEIDSVLEECNEELSKTY